MSKEKWPCMTVRELCDRLAQMPGHRLVKFLNTDDPGYKAADVEDVQVVSEWQASLMYEADEARAVRREAGLGAWDVVILGVVR